MFIHNNQHSILISPTESNEKCCDESHLSFWVKRTYTNMLIKYNAIKVGVGGVWRGAKSAHAILEQPLRQN